MSVSSLSGRMFCIFYGATENIQVFVALYWMYNFVTSYLISNFEYGYYFEEIVSNGWLRCHRQNWFCSFSYRRWNGIFLLGDVQLLARVKGGWILVNVLKGRRKSLILLAYGKCIWGIEKKGWLLLFSPFSFSTSKLYVRIHFAAFLRLVYVLRKLSYACFTS